MLRGVLLLLAGALCLLGLLTSVQSPDWSPWRLAVLAGEFGHWLALPALAVAIAAWVTRGGGRLPAMVTLALAFAAAVLLLKPAVQASRIAANLPEVLKQNFGPAEPAAPAFSYATLWFGRTPAPVAPQTLTVPPGLPLDFYPPVRRAGSPPAPCVIVIHGGGWDSGDRTQLPGLNHWLAGRGCAVAAISYRLAPRAIWPAQRDDVLAAIAFLKAQAGELGINPARLVLLGRSAGGQIALATAATAGDPAIRGVAALYAPSDLIFGYVNTHENDMLKSPALMRRFLGGTPVSARANYESASPLFHVTPRTPPTLLLHGGLDAVSWYRHSERLAVRLAEQGVPHAYVALPWATHAFEYNLNGPGGQLTRFALDWFLAGVTR
jgi:acetyl esterase/lipase